MPSPTPRVVLITGCSSGIGRETAQRLLDRGHTVCLTARRPESIDALKRDFADRKNRVEIDTLDLTDPETGRRAVENLIRKRGRIDALVNNAAYGLSGPVEELTPTDLKAQFETNLFGTIELTRAVLPHMRSARAGRIINISSVVAHVSLPLLGAYNATKAALNALTQSLRMELRKTGIHVILIEPGPIRSAFRENSLATIGEKHANPDSPYHRHYRAWAEHWQRELGQNALPPHRVAAAVTRALESPKPRCVYRVGLAAKSAPILAALLPARLVDWIILRRFNLT